MQEPKITVLLIEDLKIAQVAAFSLFKKMHYNLHIVTNGVKGLEQVLVTHYDIVFVDLQLPDISGYELAKTIRNIERRCSVRPGHIGNKSDRSHR